MKHLAAITKEQLRSEIEEWAKRIGTRPKRIQIQRMSRKWASCSTAGRLSFSTDLLKEARNFREVVIVHELIHLSVPNHGKLFKSLMSAYLPDWERIAVERKVQVCGQRN